MADSQYQQVVVPLRGGLDLVSPRYAVTPGTLQDNLNYETYSIAGYGVMEGIARYDGTTPCFNRDWVVATRFDGSGTFIVGEYLKNGDNFFGQVVAWDGTNGILSYLILNPEEAPKVGEEITGFGSSATLTADTGGIARASLYYSDMASFLAAQKSIYETIRLLKKSIYFFDSYEKNVIPHGLHWYRGALYVIADSYQVAFDTGAVETLPGDKILLVGAPIATILSTTVTSGSWSTGDAAGTMVLRTDGFLVTNSVTTGSKTIRRPDGATGNTDFAAAFTITDTQVPNSPNAQLFQGPLDDDYQTTAQINNNALRPGKYWKPVDMGWEIQFTTDDDTTGDAPATVFRGEFSEDLLSSTQNVTALATSETLDSTATVATPFGGTSFTVPAATALHTVLGDGSSATFAALPILTGPDEATGTYAILKGYNLASIPDGAILTGIEVTATITTGGATTGTADFSLAGDGFAANPSSVKTAAVPASSSAVPYILGGDGDLWGVTLSATNFLAAVRDDATFGLRFKLTEQVGGGAQRLQITDVSLKVFYKTPVTAYYAHDPVSGQDLQVTIPYYHLSKGIFNPGATQALWATGSMAVYSITPLDSTGGLGSVDSSTWTIGGGWELRTARDGGGDLIAKFSSQMQAAVLPNRSTLDSAHKRFEIITANYYANSDWVAFYGVSGVGPSFQYDGYYFYNVYTALPSTEDTPSHIAYHRNYAVLGYDNGQCIVSFPGQPTNFDPVVGSTIYAFGDRITGLLSLNGTALGVFCEASVHALAGDVLTATEDNNAVQQVISPYSGAIEYTVVDCGIPLFADFRGISTIDATDKYGDFENGRVSYQITPYLMDRVNDRFAYQATSQNILFALPVRNKNQYRLYFADGAILTCGLPTGDRGYEFTKQSYLDTNNLDTMIPVFMCTGTSRSGRDLIFGTFKLKTFDETNITTPKLPEREIYVYSIDKGTRFDLAPIKHFARLNFMSLDAPAEFTIVRTARIEILDQNYFNGYTNVAGDYQAFNATKRPVEIDPTGKPVRIIKDSDYLTVQLEGRGTTVALEIGGEHIYPGHVLQALVVFFMGGKQQLGNSPNQKTR
jgi:hypothetical protein